MRTIHEYKYSQHISCSAIVGQLMYSDGFWLRGRFWWRQWLAQTNTCMIQITRYMCASKAQNTSK